MKPPMAKNKDLRNYCIIPIEAVRDHRLHGTSAFSVLALICTYTDYLGVTWVSQGKIAQELGISRQAVWRQVKKLKEYGYIVEEKALNKWQTTKSLKVVFKNAPKDIEEAKANLTAAQQIGVEEGRRQAANQFKQQATENLEKINRQINDKSVDNSVGGATSEVAGGETPLGCTNEPYNDKGINYYSDEARQFCVMFLRSAESFGTPRIINDRDVDVMSTWIRNGLTREKWAKILQDHWEYCRDKHRDYARGIGYFTNPVERVTTKKARSYNHDASSILKKTVRSTRGF
jgi:DNA-binding Lrp family transcriptional regulator